MSAPAGSRVRRLPAALLAGLVDDAAVFPPGNAPLPVAVRRHAGHRTAWYAACVGPLLLPAGDARLLLRILDEDGYAAPLPVRVAVVARPGTDAGVVADGVAALLRDGRVEVAGAEVGWAPGWRAAAPAGIPLAVEVPRAGEDQEAALDELAAESGTDRVVRAKFRTGPTPTWPWPDEPELARFLSAVAARSLPCKLTGGLHHALRGRYAVAGSPQENHGLLNVLAATLAAVEGAAAGEVGAVLGVRDVEPLRGLLGLSGLDEGLGERKAARVRRTFAAYGCCEVTDPVGELVAHGLLEDPTR